MDANKARLGRGLDALLGDTAAVPTAVPVASIKPNPYQPRKRFDDDELKQLAASVKQHGILQPLAVRAADGGDGGFQLIAGERRLRAAQMAGLTEVPVHVVRFDEQQVYEAALAENIQRSDLNPIEKAAGFKDYLDRYKLTHDQLGAKLGIDRSSVSNLVGLLALPADVQEFVRSGQVSLGHAKVLKGAGGAEKQSAWCKRVVMEGLSVAALDAAIKAEKAKAQAVPAERDTAPKAEKTPHVISLENDLRERFACKVEIKLKAEQRGQIVIGFETGDDFERIVAGLGLRAAA
jgi:ParB family chromosome partitioning protein